MSEHLIRFLRAEVVARWPIDPDCIPCLDGSDVQLAALLQDNFNFSHRRAFAEVDQFFCEFHARLRLARQVLDMPVDPMARSSAA
jgi:hypothetical protein